MDIEKIFTLEDTEDTKGRLRSVAQKIEDVDQQMISLSQTCLPSFDSDEIGKKWLDNFLTQIGDTVTKEAKAKQGSKENIKNILALMKRFKDNEYFEEKGSRIFYHLSFVDSVRINIFQSGVLEYLGNIFKKNWYSGKIEIQTMVNVLFVFKQMSFCPEAHKEMLTDSFLEMILLPFSNSIFSRCHILAGDTLVDLLDTADKCWIARLTKVEVESTVMKSMDKWQLGVICPINYKSLTPQWTNISNGTMVRQRFCAWVIANAIMANPKKYIEMLKKEDFMPKAEAIIADSSTDPEVKRLVKITLDVLKK